MGKRLRLQFIAVLCLLVLLGAATGCSHGQQGFPSQRLYAVVPETQEVLLYAVNASDSDQAQAMIKEKAPDKPAGVSTDLTGEVFVLNENGNVRGYGSRDHRHYQVVRTIEGPNTGLVHPTSIVSDVAGSLYVGEDSSPDHPASVEWFAGGQTGDIFPNRVLEGPHTGITSPSGVALDGSGRLFVADRQTNKILVFAASANGDARPITTLGGLKSPNGLFVDQLLNVYATNGGDNSIAVFISTGPFTWKRSGTITSSALQAPQGIAVDAQERIAVAVTGGILFFAPNSSGSEQPTVDLRGSSAMNPAGIFIR